MSAVARSLPLSVYREVRRSRITFLAAAIAYYGFVSVIPLALLGLAVAQAVDGPGLGLLFQEAEQFLSPAAAEIIERSLTGTRGSGGASLLSLLVLAWSASKVFRGLDVAFSQVDGGVEAKSIPGRLIDAAVVLVSIPLALGASAFLASYSPISSGSRSRGR
ncbi:MAG: YhjD/YihY/BrkB family envelope integrity protein [Halodesulfurarchaeum sp.]